MPDSTGSSPVSIASAEAPTAAAVVELVDAHKKFGSVEALRGVSLAVKPGELVGLLGPNGAGKTTAISLMIGLRRPTAGKALLFGLDPSDLRARSRTGVMLQESGIPPTLKVREVVELFRTYYPKPLPTDAVVVRLDGQARETQKIRLVPHPLPSRAQHARRQVRADEVRGIAEGERIRVVRSEERNDIATADAEAVARPRIAVNGVQKVAGSDVSAAMPETGPVAGGLEPLHQALDIQGIGKYHRLLPTCRS